MLNFVKKIPIIKNLFRKSPEITHLGRWSFADDAKLYRRADLSNEDHCGPCGAYILEQSVKNIPRFNVRTQMEIPTVPKKVIRVERSNVRTQF